MSVPVNSFKKLANVVTTDINSIKNVDSIKFDNTKTVLKGYANVVTTTFSNDDIATKGKNIANIYANTGKTIYNNTYNTLKTSSQNSINARKNLFSNTSSSNTKSAVESALSLSWNLAESVSKENANLDEFLNYVDAIDPNKLKTLFENAALLYKNALATAAKGAVTVVVSPVLAAANLKKEADKVKKLSTNIKNLKTDCNNLIIQLESIRKKLKTAISDINSANDLLKSETIFVSGDNKIKTVVTKLNNRKSTLEKTLDGVDLLISKLKELTSWDGGTVA